MRQPRAKRAPRGPRVRKTRAQVHQDNHGIWNAECRDCKMKFRVLHGPKPKHCISCKSKKLAITPGRLTAQERAERDARFLRAASRMVSLFLDLFGIPYDATPRMNGTPSGSPFPPLPAMSRHEAALFLAVHSCVPKDYILDSAEARDNAYKRAARKLHPDTGGSHELFVKLQQAKAVLD